MICRNYGDVLVKIFETREEMGAEAADEVSQYISTLLEEKEEINCMFAAAPSQSDFLQSLVENTTIAWERINAFHMDEYIGLEQGSEQSFSGFLNTAIFNRVPFKSIHLINGKADSTSEVERYSNLLRTYPTDIVFLGIGENGHLAFNDPSVADFEDPALVKVVELEKVCREQQVHDLCFLSLDNVPTHAFTVTIPGLMRSKQVFCIVPTELKATATANALKGPISTACPASILRTKANTRMYIDAPCASLL